MLRFSLTCLLIAWTLQLPAQEEKAEPITAENGDRLKLISETDREVFRMKRGPRTGEFTFSLRRGEVEIVDEQTLLPRRTVTKDHGQGFVLSLDETLESWTDRRSKKTVIRNTKTGNSIEFKAGRMAIAPVFSPDKSLIAIGDSVVTAGGEGAGFSLVRMFDTRTGDLVHKLDQSHKGHGGVHPVFSPDGKLLAVGSRNYETRIFEVSTGKQLQVLPRRMTQEVSFSPDGKTLAAGYVRGEIGLWDVATGELKHVTATGMDEVYSVDWHPDGNLLAASGRGGVSLWNPDTLTKVSQVVNQPWVIQTRFTHDGTRLLTSGANALAVRKMTLEVWTVDGKVVGKAPEAAPAWKRPKPLEGKSRPNILFAIADDWGYPHAGAYGDPVVKTPTFDRIAKEGILFEHAFVSSPSCTPSRGAILTGRHFWQLKSAANLWSVFPDEFETFPETLKKKAGYFTGYQGKGWGPGKTETAGRELTGKRFPNFKEFLASRPKDTPFCYWLGTSDPHRPYKPGSGKASGMDLSKIVVPPCFPDSEVVRSDIADYLFEVQRFDKLVGTALQQLEEAGELDNTIIVMTSDHGMPFPRAKAHLYDTGVRVPLAIRFGKHIKAPGRKAEHMISQVDLAPTFLDLAGLYKPKNPRSDRSLWDVLSKDAPAPTRGRRYVSVLFGRERHVPGQEAPNMGGYPSRAVRSKNFLGIRNYAPDRWPSGTPNHEKAAIPGAWYADTDNGPTKMYMIENRDKDDQHRLLYDLAFGKRPERELYDLRDDPHQLKNVANGTKYIFAVQSFRPDVGLKNAGDPRALGEPVKFDEYPYLGGAPKHPNFKK